MQHFSQIPLRVCTLVLFIIIHVEKTAIDFAHSQLWSSSRSFVMANPRGARRTSLGVLSGGLRGGFTASSLPDPSPRPPRLMESPNATTYPSSPSPAPSDDQHDRDPAGLMGSTSGDVFAHLASMSSTLLAVHEAVKGMDRRVASVEEAQLKGMIVLKSCVHYSRHKKRLTSLSRGQFGR